MKKIMLSISGMVLLVMFFAQPVQSANVIPPDDRGDVTVSGTEVRHNVYTAGNDVRIESQIQGDLHTAGARITIDEAVEQDVTVAGGEVIINAPVGQDVRVAGGDVVIKGTVGGDVIVFAGDVSISDGATVGGDVIAYGGTVVVNGLIGGRVNIKGGTVALNSRIAGDVKVSASDSLTFGSKAETLGKISFKGPREAIVENGAKVGSIDFQKTEQREGIGKKLAVIFTLAFIIKLLAVFAGAILLARLFPKTSQSIVNSMFERPWMNMLLGFAVLLVMPLAVIILFGSFIGYYVALIVLFTYILLLMLAGLSMIFYIGTWINQLLTGKKSPVKEWQSIVLGVVALGIASLIPVLGVIVILGLLLIGLGSIARSIKGRIDSEQLTKEAII